MPRSRSTLPARLLRAEDLDSLLRATRSPGSGLRPAIQRATRAMLWTRITTQPGATGRRCSCRCCCRCRGSSLTARALCTARCRVRIPGVGPQWSTSSRTVSSRAAHTGTASLPAGNGSPVGRVTTGCAAGMWTSSDCASPSRRASNTSTGYYSAYRHMLDDELDLIPHVGDWHP